MNLLSGCMAVIFALSGRYYGVACCVALSALFDFCDGFAARLLHAYSPMGKELDSLADLVSFGLAPGLLLKSSLSSALPEEYSYVAYVALLIPVFSALRLAKFNVDDRQATSFIGLPVPADALWWIGVCHSFTTQDHSLSTVSLACIVVAVPVFAYLMVSEIPMFSLKFANYRWHDNVLRYVLLLAAAVLLLWLRLSGLAPVIGLYILLSLYAVYRVRK